MGWATKQWSGLNRWAPQRRQEKERIKQELIDAGEDVPWTRREVNGWELCRVRTENGTSVAVQKSSNLYVYIYIWYYMILYDLPIKVVSSSSQTVALPGKMLKFFQPWHRCLRCLEPSPGAILQRAKSHDFSHAPCPFFMLCLAPTRQGA